MFLIILIVVLSLLRYFEISIFADLSWWWIGALLAVTVLWFEVFEKMLGLDKKKAHETLKRRAKNASSEPSSKTASPERCGC